MNNGQDFKDSGNDTADTNNSSTLNQNSMNISILDFLLILLDRKRFIFLGVFSFGVISVILVLLTTSYYTAISVVLPSQQKMGLPLGSLLGDSPGGLMKSLDLLGGQDNNSRFLSILESRRLADKVIERFELEKRYGFLKKKKYFHEDVLKQFHKNVWAEEDENQNIKICAKDSTPEVAAAVANYVAEQLDSISYLLAQSSARGSRLFFEERLKIVRRDLDSVHRAFADFQIANNFIDLDAQVKSTIETVAGLEAEVMATDIETDMISSSFGSNSRIAESKQKKAVLSRRLAGYLQNGNGSLVLPLKKTPELAIQYANLFRAVKVQEGINSMIIQLYEQAKFREANNSPVVIILEKALVPEKRTSPKRMVFCLIATLFGFFLLVTWVLIQKWYSGHKSRQSKTAEKLTELFDHFRIKK